MEPAGALPILDRPLAALQEDEARAAGFAVVDVGPDEPLPPDVALAGDADLVFSRELLEALVRAPGAGPRRAALRPDTALAARMSPLAALPRGADGALALPLWRIEGGRVDDDAPLAVVGDEDGALACRVDPLGPPPHTLLLPDVTRVGGVLRHWLHVLEANLAFLALARRRVGARGAKSVRGPRCRVHGTALVEGSVLGAGVEIEAGATVLDSFLGDGVKIAAHSVIVGSVIGRECHTLIDTSLRRVVALEGSTLSNVGTTDALFGRAIFITTGVQFFAGDPGETVVVDGVDTGRPVLSGAVGHHAILGARALFTKGVAVPNRAVIVMRPDEGATRLDEQGLARASMMRGDPGVDV